MTLPSAGPLSIRDIATESGRANNLGAFYSAFPGIPASGSISISQFYGKSATFTLNIVAAVASPNIRQLAMNAGWDQSAKLIVNVNADINTLRLDAGLSFPQGVRLNISAGVRVGGVRNGGTALFTRVPVEINNLGTISGGGGAGGAGESVYFEQAGQGSSSRVWCGGGTGGDGTGYVNTASLAVTSSSGAVATTYSYTGDVVGTQAWGRGGTGGNGGGWGANGSYGQSNTAFGGGYANAGTWVVAQAGRTAGAYVDGNSFVTWLTPGVRMGTVA